VLLRSTGRAAETLGKMVKARLLILHRCSVSGPRLDEGSNVSSGHVGRECQLSDGGHNENSSTRAREVLGSSVIAFGGATKTWPHADRPRVMKGWMGSGHRLWMSGFFLGCFLSAREGVWVDVAVKVTYQSNSLQEQVSSQSDTYRQENSR